MAPTQGVFVVKGETSRSHEIDEKGLHEELGSSDRSGKPDKLSENIRVKHAHDGTGQSVEQNSSSAHTVKEQFAPEENRDIASFNTDNDFNRAINEENIDFNIPRVPNSTVKRSHGVNVQNLIQKIENHPQRQALQSDLQQHRQFNLNGCQLLEVEGTEQRRKEDDDSSEHHGYSIGNAHRIQNTNQTSNALWKTFARWLEIPIVHRPAGNSLTKPKDEKSLWTPFLLSLIGRWSKLPCEISSRDGQPNDGRHGH